MKENQQYQKDRKTLRILSFLLLLGMFTSFILSGCSELVTNPVTTGALLTESETKEEELAVFYLDVGQGDGSIIRSPEGKFMMIDAGKNKGANVLVEQMKMIGVETIEYFILTHPHEDHIGGADTVLENFDVKNVIYPDVTSSSRSWMDVENAMAKEEEQGCHLIVAEAGATYTFSGSPFEILAPLEIDYDNLNNCSVAMKYVYKETSFLFTGDAEKESEYRMVETFGLIGSLKADVLKLGHHGSKTSSDEAFLKAVSPKIGIISCGKNNDYGHPHRETMAKMEKFKIECYGTYELGNVVVLSDGKDLEVTSVQNNELKKFMERFPNAA